MKTVKGGKYYIVGKNQRCLQDLSWNITSVAWDMAAATNAATPLEKGLVTSLLRDGVELSEAEVCRLRGRHCEDKSHGWSQCFCKLLRDSGADTAYTELQQHDAAREGCTSMPQYEWRMVVSMEHLKNIWFSSSKFSTFHLKFLKVFLLLYGVYFQAKKIQEHRAIQMKVIFYSFFAVRNENVG